MLEGVDGANGLTGKHVGGTGLDGSRSVLNGALASPRATRLIVDDRAVGGGEVVCEEDGLGR